jgi:hypothetical protein
MYYNCLARKEQHIFITWISERYFWTSYTIWGKNLFLELSRNQLWNRVGQSRPKMLILEQTSTFHSLLTNAILISCCKCVDQ